MKKSGIISVVLPALINDVSGVDMTYRCIRDAREKTEIGFQLVIVETGSQYLKDLADIYICEKEKTTCTRSINRGFKVADGDYVVLLTNDVFVDDRWLECLLECFNKDDCGLSTLATSQLGHIKQDKIEEGIWFSVAMIPKKHAWFDEQFANSWDDTDLITRVYAEGKKMYRNFNCVVEHLVGKTEYAKKDHFDNYEENRKKYIEKWKHLSDTRIYKILTEGWVI